MQARVPHSAAQEKRNWPIQVTTDMGQLWADFPTAKYEECAWHKGGVGTFPPNTRKFEWDVGTRLAGHDTGLRGPRPTLPGVTAAWPKPSARQPRSRSISATQARWPWKPIPQPRRPAPQASTTRSCHLPEGARPPQRPVVRRQLLARSSSPRRVREREAVTFGASPAQGTEPRAAPAS